MERVQTFEASIGAKVRVLRKIYGKSIHPLACKDGILQSDLAIGGYVPVLFEDQVLREIPVSYLEVLKDNTDV